MKKLSSLSDLKSLINPSDLSSINDQSTISNKSVIKQCLEAHYSKKGRAGKPVIVIKCFKGSKNEMKDLAKILKNKCGVGGSVKDGQIIVQGEFREKITSILVGMGHSVKRIGG
jgi:translation initiation factor 1